MSNELFVRHLDGDRFAINIRGHQIHVDQPIDAGGEDTAPTPTELFIAGLASCVAFSMSATPAVTSTTSSTARAATSSTPDERSTQIRSRGLLAAGAAVVVLAAVSTVSVAAYDGLTVTATFEPLRCAPCRRCPVRLFR
jgi:organic hydroperoxide reductase OsmC/OhrA